MEPEKKVKRFCCVALLAIWVMVYVANLNSFQLVRDDWTNLFTLRGIVKDHGWTAFFEKTVTNDWFGAGSLRVFFVPWQLQTIVGWLAGFHSAPYFLFSFLVHACSALLLFRIMARTLADYAWAFSLSALFLVAPSSANTLFFLNNWSFLLPVFFLLLQWHSLLFPLKHPVADVAAVTAATMIGQFAGEQGIPMLYASFALWIAYYRYTGVRDGQEWRRVIIPAVLCGGALVIYVTQIVHVNAAPSEAAPFVWRAVTAYLEGYTRLLGATLLIGTWIYGRFSLAPSMSTVALAGTVLLVYAIALRFAAKNTPDVKPLDKVVAVLLLYLAASLVSPFYGMVTGVRPGAATRYLYPAGLVVVMVLPLSVALLQQRLALRLRVAPHAMAGLLFAYSSFLMLYAARDIWGVQRIVDERLWSAVDAALTPRIKQIVTINLTEDQAQPMPHRHSDAVSDFQADWGIRDRLRARGWLQVSGIAKGYSRRTDGAITLHGYYGADWTTGEDEILILTHRYGEEFKDLLTSEVQVFSNLSDYERSRQKSP